MLYRLIHEPRTIPDFHGGIRGIREQFIGARLRQIVCPAFDEAICRDMIRCIEEVASIAGHGRSFWRGVLRQATLFFGCDSRLSAQEALLPRASPVNSALAAPISSVRRIQPIVPTEI
jgi:hypothetical protein